MWPFTLEIRDAAGGRVLARSHDVTDCILVLERLAGRKHREARELQSLSPVSAAALQAEERRLREIASLIGSPTRSAGISRAGRLG
jgi:hypothetical protein